MKNSLPLISSETPGSGDQVASTAELLDDIALAYGAGFVGIRHAPLDLLVIFDVCIHTVNALLNLRSKII